MREGRIYLEEHEAQDWADATLQHDGWSPEESKRYMDALDQQHMHFVLPPPTSDDIALASQMGISDLTPEIIDNLALKAGWENSDSDAGERTLKDLLEQTKWQVDRLYLPMPEYLKKSRRQIRVARSVRNMDTTLPEAKILLEKQGWDSSESAPYLQKLRVHLEHNQLEELYEDEQRQLEQRYWDERKKLRNKSGADAEAESRQHEDAHQKLEKNFEENTKRLEKKYEEATKQYDKAREEREVQYRQKYDAAFKPFSEFKEQYFTTPENRAARDETKRMKPLEKRIDALREEVQPLREMKKGKTVKEDVKKRLEMITATWPKTTSWSALPYGIYLAVERRYEESDQTLWPMWDAEIEAEIAHEKHMLPQSEALVEEKIKVFWLRHELENFATSTRVGAEPPERLAARKYNRRS